MLMTPPLLAAALLGGALGLQDPEATPNGRTHYLGREVARTMHWRGAPWLMRETREQEENGERLRKWLAVQPGASVCDLGCGNGYHTLPLAQAVGSEGRVYAVDLQPRMLELLEERAQEAGVGNLVPIEATVDDPGLPEASCDLVLLVDVYHEISHPVSVLGHLRRALRPGGEVVLVEFRTEDKYVPIKPEHKMTKAQVVREMAANGFELARETDALPWQHAMAFRAVADPGPRFEARRLVTGFLAAASALDPRVVEPYLAARVDTGEAEPVSRRDLGTILAEGVRGMGAPLGAGVRAELRAGPEGKVVARLESGPEPGWLAERSELVLGTDEEGRWQVEAWRPPAASPRGHGSRWPFVAMNTGTGDAGTPAEQGALTLELGFDGIGWGIWRVPEVRRACEERGGDVWSVYCVLDLADPEAANMRQLRQAMEDLRGGPGMVWLAVRSASHGPHDASADPRALQILAPLLDHAEATGVEIALYPHSGFWMETSEDALRLLKQLEHPRLGLCFNLCHFLKGHEGAEPLPLLEAAGERLFAVTLNGADAAGADWGALIQPLGEGDLDLGPLLEGLGGLGFRGPVGLQAFGIREPSAAHLERSMAAWRALQER